MKQNTCLKRTHNVLHMCEEVFVWSIAGTMCEPYYHLDTHIDAMLALTLTRAQTAAAKRQTKHGLTVSWSYNVCVVSPARICRNCTRCDWARTVRIECSPFCSNQRCQSHSTNYWAQNNKNNKKMLKLKYNMFVWMLWCEADAFSLVLFLDDLFVFFVLFFMFALWHSSLVRVVASSSSPKTSQKTKSNAWNHYRIDGENIRQPTVEKFGKFGSILPARRSARPIAVCV